MGNKSDYEYGTSQTRDMINGDNYYYNEDAGVKLYGNINTYYKGIVPVPYFLNESHIRFDGKIDYKDFIKRIYIDVCNDTINVYHPTYTLKRKIFD